MAAPSCWSPGPRAARLCACAATNEGEASVKSRIRRGGGSVGGAALLMLALLPAHSGQKVKKPAAGAAPAGTAPGWALPPAACWDPEGKVLAQCGQEELERPGGIALDRERHRLYVADAKANRVAVFDTENFKLERTVGGPSTPGGTSTSPTPGTTACKSLTAAGAFCAPSGVMGRARGTLCGPRASPWTPRGTCTWWTPSSTISKFSRPKANRCWPSAAWGSAPASSPSLPAFALTRRTAFTPRSRKAGGCRSSSICVNRIPLPGRR